MAASPNWPRSPVARLDDSPGISQPQPIRIFVRPTEPITDPTITTEQTSAQNGQLHGHYLQVPQPESYMAISPQLMQPNNTGYYSYKTVQPGIYPRSPARTPRKRLSSSNSRRRHVVAGKRHKSWSPYSRPVTPEPPLTTPRGYLRESSENGQRNPLPIHKASPHRNLKSDLDHSPEVYPVTFDAAYARLSTSPTIYDYGRLSTSPTMYDYGRLSASPTMYGYNLTCGSELSDADSYRLRMRPLQESRRPTRHSSTQTKVLPRRMTMDRHRNSYKPSSKSCKSQQRKSQTKSKESREQSQHISASISGHVEPCQHQGYMITSTAGNPPLLHSTSSGPYPAKHIQKSLWPQSYLICALLSVFLNPITGVFALYCALMTREAIARGHFALAIERSYNTKIVLIFTYAIAITVLLTTCGAVSVMWLLGDETATNSQFV